MTANNGAGLSDFWRIDRSRERASELSSVLHGADTLIGNMGSDIEVRWSGDGLSYTDFRRRIVALDYGPVADEECPFAGASVDEVIGYAAHEGGHCLWSQPGVEQTIIRQVALEWSALPAPFQHAWHTDSQTVMAELRRIQNVLEDCYIDYQVARHWPVLGEYIGTARNRLLECIPTGLRAEVTSQNPDRNAVVKLWAGLALYDQPRPTGLPAPVERCLEHLLELSDVVRNEGGASARQAMAVEADAILWGEFPTELPTSPEPPEPEPAVHSESSEGHSDSSGPRGRDGHPEGAAEGGADIGVRGEDGEQAPGAQQPRQHGPCGPHSQEFDLASALEPTGRRIVQVPEELLRDMAGAVDHDQEDLSQPVALALGESPRLVSVTARQATYDKERADRVISEVRREIKEVRHSFRQQRELRTRWIHGLDRGKLDESRLWKVLAGDPGYRKRRDVPERPSLAVGLLLDTSGSMGQHADIVEQTGAIFSQGLVSNKGIDFAVWCYTGKIAEVVLTKVSGSDTPRLCLGDLEPGGSTPSGVAIAAATELLGRMPKRKRLLIHFTDGLPDDVGHVRRAVHSAREAGIQVYAIGLPEHEKMLADQYGDRNHQTIESVPELPMAVARILGGLSAPQNE